MPIKHLILCGSASLSSRQKDWRRVTPITLDASSKGNVHLRISDITSRMVAKLPDAITDLVEIATYVYCADQATTRGGTKTFEYGRKWRRHFRFEIPVRRPDLWSAANVLDPLVETLGFLSDDDYEFSFNKLDNPPPMDSYLEFDQSTVEASGIQEVVLFSGGLDSFGGAVEEVLTHHRKVALVSHRPVSKLDSRQRQLVADLAAATNGKSPAPFHVPVWINKDKEIGKEYTQRSRSFLYASLGAVVAKLFNLNRIRFYENGVVSLNLPISEQALGGRTTRTTHPQVLNGLATLFSAVFGQPFAVENPFLWKTKTAILQGIKAAGFAKLCAHTTSCAHTWEMTKMWSHCGKCSQCVDRRLVAMAAGFDDTEDPAEMYKLDVLHGERTKTEDVTLAESYVKTMNEIEGIDNAVQFCTRFGEVSRLLNHLPGKADTVADEVFKLYKKHAKEVCDVLDAAGKAEIAQLRRHTYPDTCLLSIAFSRAAKRGAGAGQADATQAEQAPAGGHVEGQVPVTLQDKGDGLHWIVGGEDTGCLPKGALAEWSRKLFENIDKNYYVPHSVFQAATGATTEDEYWRSHKQNRSKLKKHVEFDYDKRSGMRLPAKYVKSN